MRHTAWLVLLGGLLGPACNRTPPAPPPPFRPVADVLGQLDAPLKADWKSVTAIAWICAYRAKLGVWLGN